MGVHISFNGSVARIEGLDPVIGEALHSNLREYWQEGIQKALDTVGSDFPNDGCSLIMRDGKDWIIKTGLLSFVCKKLKSLKVTFTLTKNIKEATFGNSPYANKPRKFEAYDYQSDAAEKCLRSKRGYVEAPTGSGKSVLIAEVLAQFGEDDSVLVTVPSVLLLHQMKKDIMEYLCTDDEDEIGLIGEGNWKPKRITVAIGDTLYEGIKRGKVEVLSYLDEVVAWISDEIHLTLNATYFSIASKLTNVQYAIGLSATPFDNHLFLEALYGPKLLTIKPEELVSKK